MRKSLCFISYFSISCLILLSGCKNKNEAPDNPATPTGPSSGLTNISYTFITSAIDPEGDSVSIQFDWGNGVTSNWSNYVVSGASVSISYAWLSAGTYQVKAQAKDKKGKMSGWSTTKTITITATSPPNTPSTPAGPSIGSVNTQYSFTSSTTDPDNDSIAIRFDWGNGDTSNWSPFVPSGQTVTAYHSWSSNGIYNIKAQAKDKNNASSNWSVEHSITMSTAIGWTKTFGGAYNDYGYSVQQTSDGGYIITGTKGFWSTSYVYLIKTNVNGDTTWTKIFGGTGSDSGYSVQQTSDGGYIIAGYNGYSYSVYLIKTDANGNQVWTKTNRAFSYGYSVQQTSDGGYIITGEWLYPYVYLIKTNANGDTIWAKTYGRTCGYSVQQTSDGGYIITGNRYGGVYLIKTNANGDTIWTKTFGGTGNGYSVRQTSDGGYIIAGYTSSFGAGGYDVYLIKTNANGDTIWTKTFGGTGNDCGYSVQQTLDGGYIIAGYTSSFGAGGYDVYLIKTDANGNAVWTKTFGGNDNDYGRSVQQTSDGGYIITGYTASFGAGGSDVYLIKTDANGNTK